MLRGLSLSLNISLNTSHELTSVLLSLLCLLTTLTFVRPPSLCPLVLRNTRTQVSQGHSTYTEAKSSNPSHLLHLSLTSLHTYLCSHWSSSEETVLTESTFATAASSTKVQARYILICRYKSWYMSLKLEYLYTYSTTVSWGDKSRANLICISSDHLRGRNGDQYCNKRQWVLSSCNCLCSLYSSSLLQ